MLDEGAACFRHEPDHVIAEKHGGETTAENLALACFACYRFKGSDIASLDPVSGELAPLFNPRVDRWSDHLTVAEGRIVGLTAVGRATEQLSRLNLPERVEVRTLLARVTRHG
ncbi:MAG: HNH endonuclease [Planctomycetaceae bacterium]